MLTHWKKLTNPNFTGAYAFEPGEEKAVTIDRVEVEELPNRSGNTEQKMVLHFTQPDMKPLVLNKTNAQTVETVLDSPYIEDWRGKSIVLTVRRVTAFGAEVDAVRVKPEKNVYLCATCGRRIKAAGKMTTLEIVQYAVEKYDHPLCADCMKAMKEQT